MAQHDLINQSKTTSCYYHDVLAIQSGCTHTMSNGNGFSVFPPPRIPRVTVPTPGNRKPSLKTVKPLDSFHESVVVTLQEVPESRASEERIPRKPVQNTPTHPQAATSSAAKRYSLPPPPPLPKNSQTARNTPVKEASSSPQSSPEPGSISSSETLVRSSSDEEPMKPIRSMFPTYDPSVPLSQQSYYPQRLGLTYDAKQPITDSTRPNVRSRFAPSLRDSIASRANQASIVDVPLDVLNFREPTYSTLKDLERLWNLASNSESTEPNASFDLELGRLDDAIFTFGSSPDTPFYTITTFDTAEIGLTKTCPRRSTLSCDVSLTTIEDPARRLPPNDGLVSFIFPKLAAMLAINQSKALAEEYNMPPSDLEEIQEAAMKRAANQEASQLRWNAVDKRYELDHPAVSRKNRETNFVSSPLSPQGQTKPVIHITVATSDQPLQDRPVILVTFPSTCSPAGSNIASYGSPMLPASTAEISLASLDFNTNTLHIEANNILETMPSLFAIDSIVSALASVAITDPDANVAMGRMKVWTPKTAPMAQAAQIQPVIGTPTGGQFYATIAEREEAEDEARAAAKNHRKSVRRQTKLIQVAELPNEQVDVEAGRTWYGKSKVKKPKKKKQIVIGEFDLEKLTHYQSGARQGQELPALTRGLLSALVSSLKFVVWLQTIIVQFICWLLVSLTRGVTSEKF